MATEDRAWRKALKRVLQDVEVTFQEGKKRSISGRETIMGGK